MVSAKIVFKIAKIHILKELLVKIIAMIRGMTIVKNKKEVGFAQNVKMINISENIAKMNALNVLMDYAPMKENAQILLIIV